MEDEFAKDDQLHHGESSNYNSPSPELRDQKEQEFATPAFRGLRRKNEEADEFQLKKVPNIVIDKSNSHRGPNSHGS